MKGYTLKLIIAFLFISSNESNAQSGILRKIKSKVEQKVNQKIDRKIDQEIDKVLDSVWNEDKQRYEAKDPDTRTNEEIEQDIVKKSTGLFGFETIKDVQKEYNFTSRVDFEIIDGNGKDAMNYSMFSESNGEVLGMHFSDEKKKNEMFVIINYNKEYMVNIMEDSKQYMALSLNSKLAKNYIDTYANDALDATQNLEIQKTGRTKTISGFHCEEYVIIDENGIKTESWITKDLDDKNIGFFESIRKMAKQFKSSNLPNGVLEGFMIEALVYNKKDKLDTRILVTNVSEGKFSKSLQAYTSMY